jgi:hypothetical protein
MKIIIAGWGRSGTTALFFRLKKALPRDTKCIFEPRKYDASMDLPADNVLVKTLIWRKQIRSLKNKSWSENQLDHSQFQHFDKKILIVRDPRDRMISALLYSVWGATLIRDERKFQEYLSILEEKEKFPEKVAVTEIFKSRRALNGPDETTAMWVERLKERLNICIQFHEAHPEYFLFHYEDMVRGNLKGLEEYLGLTLSGDADIEAGYERIVRTKGAGDWKNWFLKEDADFFKPILKDYMERYGYQDDWATNSSPVIEKRHATAFVKKLREERIQWEDGNAHREEASV